MKLLVYSPLSLRFGGGFENWILDVATHLSKFGVSMKIMCTKSTVGDTERISSATIQEILNKVFIEYFEVPYIPFSVGGSNSPIPSVKAMRKILTTIDFDVLYFTNAYAFQDIFLYLLKIIHKKPVISAQHAVMFRGLSLHDLYINTLGKTLLKRFDAHHVLNTQDMQIFKKWGLKSVYLIPSGVDTVRFKPKELFEKHTKFKVLFVGRLTSQKGIDLLCNSIELINKDDYLQKNLEFIIVGSGPMSPLVQNFTKRYTNVKYLGRVKREFLPKIYRDCDVFIMPSQRETFGIVALEAQACGLPIIAPDISGLKDIIINDYTGTLTLKRDSASFASEIKKYYVLWIHDYEKYKQMCNNARDNVVKRFGWSVIIKHIYRMLTNVYSR